MGVLHDVISLADLEISANNSGDRGVLKLIAYQGEQGEALLPELHDS